MIPLLGVILLIELLATFIDAWRDLQGVSIELYELAVPTAVAVAYFALAAILVPRDLQDWPNLDEHFDHRRLSAFSSRPIPSSWALISWPMSPNALR